MITGRANGLAHIYLDKSLDQFSNVAVGLLARATGAGLKVAYIDIQNTATRFTNFLENLCLNYTFPRRFDRLHIETFSFKEKNKIAKGIIPLVEFYNIDEKMFWNSLKSFDLIIFDNADLNIISKFSIISFLENKPIDTEVVFTLSDEKQFNEIKDYFDLISIYKNIPLQKGVIGTKNIFTITGNGKGKSTYSFGYLLRNFINKKDVKLIYFDKGGNFYGERTFFEALKKWSKENTLYGKFDYVGTGLPRFDGRTFRFDNLPEDIREAKEGLMLLKTALKKQTPVIAEELATTIKTRLLKIEDILPIINEVTHELVITGRYAPKEIIELSNKIIEVEDIKHYASNGYGVRKGIDF